MLIIRIDKSQRLKDGSISGMFSVPAEVYPGRRHSQHHRPKRRRPSLRRISTDLRRDNNSRKSVLYQGNDEEMEPEDRRAYLQAQSSCALIHAMGMLSENLQRLHRGESIAYAEEAFTNLAMSYGLEHNQVMAYLVP